MSWICKKCETENDESLRRCEVCGESAPLIYRFGEYNWTVLANKNGNSLIICNDIIRNIPYNNERTAVTWETCSLRKWLNGEFHASLSPEEQSRIVLTVNENDNNAWEGTKGGSKTHDRVFVLSLSEVLAYFGDSGDIKSRKKKNNDGDEDSIGNLLHDQFNQARMAQYSHAPAWWWLRTPGRNQKMAIRVNINGSIDLSGAYVQLGGSSGGVRPALWIKTPDVS